VSNEPSGELVGPGNTAEPTTYNENVIIGRHQAPG